MVLGVYYNLTEAELLPMLTDVLALLKAARTDDRFQSVTGHGRSWLKASITYAELRTELVEINAALKHVNPDLYGRRVRTVVCDFSA